jgi:hypothetical protein
MTIKRNRRKLMQDRKDGKIMDTIAMAIATGRMEIVYIFRPLYFPLCLESTNGASRGELDEDKKTISKMG